MSLFDFFRRRPSVDHPLLGVLRLESELSWRAAGVSLPFASQPLDVYVAGDREAPSASALSAIDSFATNPSLLRETIQSYLLGLWQNYFSDEEPPRVLTTPEEIWGTEDWVAISVTDLGDFAATFTFDWQHDEDPHIITVYVEDGEASDYSVDG